jgi:hypothetical protein
MSSFHLTISFFFLFIHQKNEKKNLVRIYLTHPVLFRSCAIQSTDQIPSQGIWDNQINNKR